MIRKYFYNNKIRLNNFGRLDCKNTPMWDVVVKFTFSITVYVRYNYY